MEMSPINCCHKKSLGLTLIEVLIALAIISIAMTAVIKAASQNIRATSYLQNKTVAMWVGQQVLNEARVGLISLPASPDTSTEMTTMLGRDWYWHADQEETPNKRIKKVEVSVFSHATEDENESPIVHLESYVYAPDVQ